jgi:hypothetical protein
MFFVLGSKTHVIEKKFVLLCGDVSSQNLPEGSALLG